MKKNLFKLFSKFPLLFSFLVLFPFFALAQNTNCDPLTGLGKLICQMNQILNSVIPLLVSLGVVYFVWGVVNYVISDSEEAKKKGKDSIIYGIIGFAVIIGLWGLVNILVTTFDLAGNPPLVASGGACVLPLSPKFNQLLDYISCIIKNSVIPLIFMLASTLFVWGVVQYVINNDEESKKTKGKQFMIWGIVGLTVMISVWGLVKVLGGTFGIETSVLPSIAPPSATP